MGFYDQAFSNIGNVIDRAAMTIGGKILANDMIKKSEKPTEPDKLDINFNDEWQEKYDTAMKSMQGRAEAIAVQRQNFELRKKLITERMNLLEKGGKK